MSASRSALSVGLFFVAALVLIVGAVLFFSRGSLFQKQLSAVAYFDGSVAGLTVGAPVNFRGVRVGYVESIRLRLEDRREGLRIPVYLRLSEKAMRWDGQRGDIEMLIERGLRAKLDLQSIVTGQLLVELDFEPDSDAPRYGGTRPGEPPEIPTLPSGFAQLLDFLTTLPIRETVEAARGALEGIEQASARLTRVVEDLSVTFNEATPSILQTLTQVERELTAFGRQASATMRTVDQAVAGAESEFGELARELRATAEQARVTLSGLSSLTAEGAPLHRDIEDAARDLSASSRALRALAEELEARPNALIFGR